ncbi:hypothetical protein O6P43_009953 [Quillaja saponaria]|uniref:Uncharacterized protein n=1 Tax=Quillaja saponaria TaxID=32244 RepID=A0AAD7PZI6_QUISA|nr:hypothetical protein O6P43_009953 [Quillaja saponaria]
MLLNSVQPVISGCSSWSRMANHCSLCKYRLLLRYRGSRWSCACKDPPFASQGYLDGNVVWNFCTQTVALIIITYKTDWTIRYSD